MERHQIEKWHEQQRQHRALADRIRPGGPEGEKAKAEMYARQTAGMRPAKMQWFNVQLIRRQ